MPKNATKNATLTSYRAKRDFKKTPEPQGEKKPPRAKERIFVVQKHAATRLHYDFRLEVDGVLKSWAVPKGPSVNPSDKRLAVMVEDHPLDYAGFEGNIPAGEYGAGAVIIWDAGYYQNIKRDAKGQEIPMAKCVADGRVEISLAGRKLTGKYALVRTGFRRDKGEDNWLMIKMKDEQADARKNPVSSAPESVLSHKTIEEIAAENGAAPPAKVKRTRARSTKRASTRARSAPRSRSAKGRSK